MNNSETRQRVRLRQCERGARYLDGIVVGEIADKSAGKRGLAGAKITGQRNHIARFDHGGDVRHQPVGGCFVGQGRVEVVVAWCGGKHRIIR